MSETAPRPSREHHLWWAAGAVTAAIFGGLGFARSLSDLLEQHDVLGALFALCMLLVLATLALMALRARPGLGTVGILLGLATVYVLLFVRMTVPAERSHLIEYSVLAALIYSALAERWRAEPRVARTATVAWLAATAVGAVDEGVQWFLPSRVFDWRDLAFNGLAAALAVVALGVVDGASSRRTRNTSRNDQAPA